MTAPEKSSKLPPVTTIKQGDTCQGCTWLVRGAEQSKGVFNWGCRFYHQSINPSKPYPTRLAHCDIDGRISQVKYERNKRPKEETSKPQEETENGTEI